MILSLFAAGLLLLEQGPARNAAEASGASSKEEQDLEKALSEAGSSPVDYSRALERHLKRYPKSERRGEYERVLAQAAIDLKDKRRILLYGIPAIEGGSRSGQLLDHVTRALLEKDDRASNELALKYARLLVEVVEGQRAALTGARKFEPLRGRRLDEIEYALARARTFEARALDNLGRYDGAAAAAAQGWEACPTEENARERARIYERAGQAGEALGAFAEALALAGDRTTAADAGRDRQRLAALAKQATGAESGFGEALLAAFARVEQAQAERRKRLKAMDPNFEARQPLEFTLSGTQGDRLEMASLRGKVVVIDFWATWCGPCRAQHPLYEQVKQRFKDNKDVVFLAVSTDEDRGVVAPFLKAQQWSPQAYYEDGMAAALRINSIPTAVVLDREGNIVSRMNGYIADRFVEMLSERIRESLEEK
jgi:thiol-disulfide isomerase/thioredoxin